MNSKFLPNELVNKFNKVLDKNIAILEVWDAYEIIREECPEYDLCIHRSNDGIHKGYYVDVDNLLLEYDKLTKFFTPDGKGYGNYIEATYEEAWYKGIELILNCIEKTGMKRFYFNIILPESEDSSINSISTTTSVMARNVQHAEKIIRKSFNLSDDIKLEFIRFE